LKITVQIIHKKKKKKGGETIIPRQGELEKERVCRKDSKRRTREKENGK
jgi:hypothetical protein